MVLVWLVKCTPKRKRRDDDGSRITFESCKLAANRRLSCQSVLARTVAPRGVLGI